jgi:hypothetical protein
LGTHANVYALTLNPNMRKKKQFPKILIHVHMKNLENENYLARIGGE